MSYKRVHEKIKRVPWRYPSTLKIYYNQIRLLHFQSPRINSPYCFDQPLVKQQIPLDNLKTLNSASPNCRIPEQSSPRTRHVAIRLFPEIEIRGGTWLRVQVMAFLERFGRVYWDGGCAWVLAVEC